MTNTNIAERIRGGWGIPCERVDGTDALAVYELARSSVERARAGYGPQALECLTLRGHGHAAHDDARYVPDDLRMQFADPVARLAAQLDPGEEAQIRRSVEEAVATGLAEAEAAPAPDPSTLEDGVYASR
jgi:pyruvate dehydrogenase E1 component alpha subunit